jgi:tryptophan-rich sensory protein
MRESIRAGIALLLPLTVVLASGLLSSQGVVIWYPTLVKPSFTPPDWLFAPVWTVLYLALGVAAYGVWRLGIGVPGVKRALGVFLVQLLLNGLWSLLFFGLQSPGAALVDIALLWLFVGWTTYLFGLLAPWTLFLLLPYWAWVTFAAALNFEIWRLNG